MNIKKSNLLYALKFSVYTLLIIIFSLYIWELNGVSIKKHKQDLNKIVTISKLNGMLEYQKAILIEVKDANNENRMIDFKNINRISGFNELLKLNNANN